MTIKLRALKAADIFKISSGKLTKDKEGKICILAHNGRKHKHVAEFNV
jgi:hypothetical protein